MTDRVSSVSRARRATPLDVLSDEELVEATRNGRSEALDELLVPPLRPGPGRTSWSVVTVTTWSRRG